MPETDIFISYSREDRDKARIMATCLEREGFVVWWDAAIQSGESFDLLIERHLGEAKAVIVLWSPRSVNSRWVRAEASSADKQGKLLPVTIEDCTRPIIFELLHTVDLSHWNGDVADPSWGQLLLDLHRTIRARKSSAPAPVAHHPANPQTPSMPAAEPVRQPIQPPPAAASAFPQLAATDMAAEEDDDEDAYEATQFSTFQTMPTGPEHFLCLMVEGRKEKQFPIGAAGLGIGRTAPAEIVLSDKHVSRRHCRVELEGEQLVVVDLGSTNGTYVDDEKVADRAVLPVGSVLRVGQCELVYELRASAHA